MASSVNWYQFTRFLELPFGSFFANLLVGAASPNPFEQHLRCWLLPNGRFYNALSQDFELYDIIVAIKMMGELPLITCTFAGHREIYQAGIEHDLDAALYNLIETHNDTQPPVVINPPADAPANVPGVDYILNKNSKKFHYPECPSFDRMKESNKEYYTGSREDLITRGYDWI